MTRHAFEPSSQYCTRCGAGQENIAAGQRSPECVAGDNVYGMSHLRYRQLFGRSAVAALDILHGDDK